MITIIKEYDRKTDSPEALKKADVVYDKQNRLLKSELTGNRPPYLLEIDAETRENLIDLIQATPKKTLEKIGVGGSISLGDVIHQLRNQKVEIYEG